VGAGYELGGLAEMGKPLGVRERKRGCRIDFVFDRWPNSTYWNELINIETCDIIL
jgi:hypothetical protein